MEKILVIEKRGNADIVHFLAQRLTDPMVADNIKEHLLNAVDAGKIYLTIDFSNVQYLSSSYLSILVALDKKVKAEGGSVNICCLNQNIASIFSIARFDMIFDIFGSENDAVTDMESKIR
ncbi:MAG: STAS domain-containing protein [Candidatus Aureabacteria bacterium]|nr:STAS domain-containing protein [Candidatus Auribacterota bacterium]